MDRGDLICIPSFLSLLSANGLIFTRPSLLSRLAWTLPSDSAGYEFLQALIAERNIIILSSPILPPPLSVLSAATCKSYRNLVIRASVFYFCRVRRDYQFRRALIIRAERRHAKGED